MAYEVLGTARPRRDQLDVGGHAEWSRRIDDAIAGGSNGTEILMCLRSVLVRLAPAVHEDAPETAAHVGAIETEIAGILTERR